MFYIIVKIVFFIDLFVIFLFNICGEFVVLGYFIMKGYFNDLEKIVEVCCVDDDGKVWVYSGDEVEMDEDGFVQIIGWIKDFIICGGENIYLFEIENCFFQFKGVREVSVVGVLDEKLGEVVVVFIVFVKGWKICEGKGEEQGDKVFGVVDVRKWVVEKLLKYLVLRDVFWVEDYFKIVSGKIQKFKLREMVVKFLEEKLVQCI